MVFGAELTNARRYATIARNGKGKKFGEEKSNRRAFCFISKTKLNIYNGIINGKSPGNG